MLKQTRLQWAHNFLAKIITHVKIKLFVTNFFPHNSSFFIFAGISSIKQGSDRRLLGCKRVKTGKNASLNSSFWRKFVSRKFSCKTRSEDLSRRMLFSKSFDLTSLKMEDSSQLSFFLFTGWFEAFSSFLFPKLKSCRVDSKIKKYPWNFTLTCF